MNIIPIDGKVTFVVAFTEDSGIFTDVLPGALSEREVHKALFNRHSPDTFGVDEYGYPYPADIVEKIVVDILPES